jgi:hypothetical protein
MALPTFKVGVNDRLSMILFGTSRKAHPAVALYPGIGDILTIPAFNPGVLDSRTQHHADHDAGPGFARS